MGEIIDFISKVGFPISVAAWILIRHDKTERDLTKAINDLRLAILLFLNRTRMDE